jgi:hypothetical protein
MTMDTTYVGSSTTTPPITTPIASTRASQMHPTAAPSKFGHHRKQRSLDYRKLEAFITDTSGKKLRNRPPT